MDLDAPKSWLGLAENDTEIKMEMHVERADTHKNRNAGRQKQ
jgi:hypothetical protein